MRFFQSMIYYTPINNLPLGILMIKLIATDMDGTLLDSQKRLPKGFPDLLRELGKRQIRFAIASGRQYYNLLNYFPGSGADDLFFLADNGAVIFENGKNIFFSEMKQDAVPGIVNAIRAVRNAQPVVCGLRSTYIENTGELFLQNVKLYYERLEIVPDVLAAAKTDRVCKIAAFDAENAEERLLPILNRYGEAFNVVLSGSMWIDLMNHGTDKGTGLRFLQERLGISPEETMAFGDYLNDAGMMRTSQYSFAMKNAHSALKNLCAYQTESNDSDGVLKAIRRFLPQLSKEESA